MSNKCFAIYNKPASRDAHCSGETFLNGISPAFERKVITEVTKIMLEVLQEVIEAMPGVGQSIQSRQRQPVFRGRFRLPQRLRPKTWTTISAANRNVISPLGPAGDWPSTPIAYCLGAATSTRSHRFSPRRSGRNSGGPGNRPPRVAVAPSYPSLADGQRGFAVPVPSTPKEGLGVSGHKRLARHENSGAYAEKLAQLTNQCCADLSPSRQNCRQAALGNDCR